MSAWFCCHDCSLTSMIARVLNRNQSWCCSTVSHAADSKLVIPGVRRGLWKSGWPGLLPGAVCEKAADVWEMSWMGCDSWTGVERSSSWTTVDEHVGETLSCSELSTLRDELPPTWLSLMSLVLSGKLTLLKELSGSSFCPSGLVRSVVWDTTSGSEWTDSLDQYS